MRWSFETIIQISLRWGSKYQVHRPLSQHRNTDVPFIINHEGKKIVGQNSYALTDYLAYGQQDATPRDLTDWRLPRITPRSVASEPARSGSHEWLEGAASRA